MYANIRQTRTFVEPFLKEFSSNDAVKIIEISVIEQFSKSGVIKLLTPYIKWRMPVERRSRYMIVNKNITKERKLMNIHNRVLGWVNLVDKYGNIRWQAHGEGTPTEIETLLKLSKRLEENK